VGVLTLLDYAFGAGRALLVETGMSIQTAAILLILGVGLLLVRPQVGLAATLLSEQSGGVEARRLMLPRLLVYVLVSVGVVIGQRLEWFDGPFAAALLVLVALVEGTIVMFLIGARLNEANSLR